MSRTTPGPARNATPSKSILKPSSALGKRRNDDADVAFDDLPSSPTKRRKVLFDEVRNRTYEVGKRTMDEVKREVRDALEGHRRGNDGSYDTLKELFSNDTRPSMNEHEEALKPQELRAYVIALTSCMPLLKDRDCNGLVKAIINCQWLGRDDDFVKVYNYFLASLISAQGSYLSPVLTMMVENFTLTRLSQWTVTDYPEVGRDTMRDRLHKSIRHLLQIFPGALDILKSLLRAKFPFPDQSVKDHMAYIHNILRIKDYAPSLTEAILDVILSRVVNIDSQMMVDLEDLDDDITAAVMYAIRDNQTGPTNWDDDGDDESDNDTESVDSDDPDYDKEAAKIKEVKDNVEKMDAILDTLFAYHTALITSDPSSDKAFDAFTVILREFDEWVLPTYKSRHTQFLIFHFAQKDERLSDAFCGQMIHIAFDQTTPTPHLFRQSAIAYLASFVARGAHVQPASVQAIFDLIIHHMNEYSDKHEANCSGPDLRRWPIFYSLAQAAMYIFCFRWQDLVVSAPEMVDPADPASYLGQDLEWPGTNRHDLLSHIRGKFNPLKVCAPVIVEEFAKLAHRLHFAYVYPLIETNKRLRLTQFMTSYATGGALRDAGYEAGDESLHVMDPYFPFDPYQLPVSKRWLEGDYVQWRGVPGLNADESDDDSDDMEDDDEVDDLEEATGTESDGVDE